MLNYDIKAVYSVTTLNIRSEVDQRLTHNINNKKLNYNS